MNINFTNEELDIVREMAKGKTNQQLIEEARKSGKKNYPNIEVLDDIKKRAIKNGEFEIAYNKLRGFKTKG